MKKFFILLLIQFSLGNYSLIFGQTPDWKWAKLFGGTQGVTISKTAIDASGNVYIVGSFALDFKSGSTILTSIGAIDAFVAKISNTGSLVWIKTANSGAKSFMEAKAITLDASNNIFIAGSFNGISSNLNTNTITRSGVRDIFISKLDNNGDFIWANSFGIADKTLDANAIALDGSGNVYVGSNGYISKFNADGSFNSNPVADEASSYDAIVIKGSSMYLSGNYFGYIFNNCGTINQPSRPSLFVQKVDLAGNCIWFRIGENGRIQRRISLSVDNNENVIVGSSFLDQDLTFKDGANVIILKSFAYENFFIVKYNSNGTLQWGKTNTSGNNESNAFICDLDFDASNNIVAQGWFSGNLTFNNTLTDGDSFIIKFQPDGTFLSLQGFNNSFNSLKINSLGKIIVSSKSEVNQFTSSFQTDWTYTITSDTEGSTNGGYHFDNDEEGNIYIGGSSTRNFIDLDSKIVYKQGKGDVLAKLNSSGVVIWVKLFDYVSYNFFKQVKTDKFGNIYAWAEFKDSITIDGTKLINPGVGYYVVKFNKDAELQWAKAISIPDCFSVGGMDVDASENVYLASSFSSTLSLNGNTSTSSNNSMDFFVVKYDALGSVKWVKTIGGSSSDMVRDLAVDASGNIIITGSFNQTVNFGVTSLTSAGSSDIFIAKYDGEGNEIWAKRAGNSSPNRAHSVSVNSSGEIYINGTVGNSQILFGTITLMPAVGSSNNFFVAKYDESGNAVWAHLVEGCSNLPCYQTRVDKNNNLYITGQFYNQIKFHNGTVLTSTSNSLYSSYVARFNSNGDFSWARQFATSSQSLINYNMAFAPILFSENNIAVSGWVEKGNLSVGSFDLISSSARNLGVAFIGNKNIPSDITLSNSTISEISPVISAVGTLSTTDEDLGDTFTYSLAKGNGINDVDNSKFKIEGAVLKTSSQISNGTYKIFIQSKDQSNLNTTKEFIITVNANSSPIAANPIPNLKVKEGDQINYQIASNAFSDPDAGDVLTFSAKLSDDSNLPSWLTFDAATRTFSGTATLQQTFTIKVIATDKAGLSISSNFNIIIEDNPPIVTNPIPNLTVKEGDQINYQVANNAFSDPDNGDVLTYSAKLSDDSNLPSWLTFDAVTRTFSGTATLQQTFTIKVTATDKAGLTATSTFQLIIDKNTAVENDEIDHVLIYPNPASTNVIIRLTENSSETKILITSIAGNTVYENNFFQTNEIKVDISKFPKGVYLVNVKTKNYETKKTFVFK